MTNMEDQKNIKYSIWEYDSVIPEDMCDYIIKKYDSMNLNYGVISNSEVNLGIRNVKTIVLEKTDWISSIFHYYGFDANFQNFNYRISGISNPQFLRYDSGMFYDVHCDTSSDMNSEPFYRKLTVILNLSDPSEYDGGDFILYSDGLTETKINQKKGSIHVFPSYLNHKINLIKRGTRYSMVAWIVGEPFA